MGRILLERYGVNGEAMKAVPMIAGFDLRQRPEIALFFKSLNERARQIAVFAISGESAQPPRATICLGPSVGTFVQNKRFSFRQIE